MSATVHQLPAIQAPAPVEADRGEWGALRAELHSRCADEDLAALWEGLKTGERRALLASARLDTREARTALERFTKFERDAIRAAVHRMSHYASQLRDRLAGERPHPSRELAAHARQALEEGNHKAALHWLGLIERGVA